VTDYTNEATDLWHDIMADAQESSVHQIAEALQAAERRGAERMRERCAQECDAKEAEMRTGLAKAVAVGLSERIRALPVEDE